MVSLRDISSLLGSFSWAIQAVPFAQCHYRRIQSFFIRKSHDFNDCLHSKVVLDDGSREDLLWWIENLPFIHGKPLSASDPDLVIFSDASRSGWGAYCGSSTVNGHWTASDRDRHINELELLAAFYSLKILTQKVSRLSVRLMLDNSTAVHYINNSGGTRSGRLNAIAADIVLWCEQHFISIQAVHLPGILNIIADQQSRVLQDSSDWQLLPEIFHLLSRRWVVKVDLFAAAWNKQLDQFISWQPQPDAIAVDAFTLNWTHIPGYAFPPFSLIHRCLSKVRRDRASLVLITPVWPTQSWFPILLEMSVEPPLVLPDRINLLQGPDGLTHPLIARRALLLAAWKLSGKDSEAKAFRTKWSNFSWKEIVKPHQLPTRAPGTVGSIGVFNQVRIPCLLLE